MRRSPVREHCEAVFDTICPSRSTQGIRTLLQPNKPKHEQTTDSMEGWWCPVAEVHFHRCQEVNVSCLYGVRCVCLMLAFHQGWATAGSRSLLVVLRANGGSIRKIGVRRLFDMVGGSSRLFLVWAGYSETARSKGRSPADRRSGRV